jgi:flagellar hook-length control protein FliK
MARQVQAVGARPANATEFASRLAESKQTAGGRQVEMIERITRMIKLSLKNKVSRVKMLLHPMKLGLLRVDLTVHDGVLSASMKTETQAARNLLLSTLGQLKDSLEQQGVQVGRIDVFVDQGAAQASAHFQGADVWAHNDSPVPVGHAVVSGEIGPTEAGAEQPVLSIHRGAIDILA